MSEKQLSMPIVVRGPVLGSLDLILDFLFHTGSGIGMIKFAGGYYTSIFVFLVSVLSLVTGGNIINGRARLPLELAGQVFVYTVALFIFWVLYASICHLMAEIMGGSGRAKDLFSMQGLSLAPFMMLIPASLIIRFFEYKINLAYSACLGILMLWSAFLNLKSIKLNYSLSYAKSAILLFLPLIYAVIIPAAVFTLVILLVMFSLFKAFIF